MTILYKATNPSGFDFYTGKTIDYAGALETGQVVAHPTSKEIVPDKANTYLSVSVEPGETLIGGRWPARLFRVEAVGDMVGGLRTCEYKRAVLQLRVVEELPSWMTFGPNGADVVAIIERARTLTADEVGKMDAAWSAARRAIYKAARSAAWNATRNAAGNAAGNAAWNAAWDAVLATLVRDLITQEQYDILMAPWRAGVGE